MSRIGKQPVIIPPGVKVNLDPKTRTINIDGPKGKLSFTWAPEVTVKWDEAEKRVVCSIPPEQFKLGHVRALWGTTRARIQLMVDGVREGFSRKLEVVGVGWTAKVAGKAIVLNVGYANPINLEVPPGVTVTIEGNAITISGADKQAVGEFAADIRARRKPEPYNGKGIKYADEVIQRKQGKVFGS
jgi:large subunit ribosomal protein L6